MRLLYERKWDKQRVTTPIESSSWASFLHSIETLLESDGFEKSQAKALALCILNYERNLHYQRQH